ncbi:hypothetical protein C8N43_0655 [Litoreibacter ponti]|uniref:Uncharacterized protein n=1 Tax=Litoreibacter ponti TaxID=1510457 RepID=A0A2T6BIY1_9RHOB|nr:hypothetical protein [Litoreibacter ponti]PTX56006.1 hypothetical protein C8N43_0655 [Litoreibacter ponti]
MTDPENGSVSIHYICQSYVEQSPGRAGLKIGKQLKYKTAAEAEDRAERELQSESCVGADAYMISEDHDSGEVGAPSFLVRLGRVPEIDDI